MELPEAITNDLGLISSLDDGGFKALAAGVFKVLVGSKDEDAISGATFPRFNHCCFLMSLTAFALQAILVSQGVTRLNSSESMPLSLPRS